MFCSHYLNNRILYQSLCQRQILQVALPRGRLYIRGHLDSRTSPQGDAVAVYRKMGCCLRTSDRASVSFQAQQVIEPELPGYLSRTVKIWGYPWTRGAKEYRAGIMTSLGGISGERTVMPPMAPRFPIHPIGEMEVGRILVSSWVE